jgi:hypothetical protein
MPLGSVADNLRAEVTSAIDSSGATAMLAGGPITLVGASIDATRRGGDTDMSINDTVSGNGLAGTICAPATRTCLPSLAETAIWAEALTANKPKIAAVVQPSRRCLVVIDRSPKAVLCVTA